MLNPFLYYIRNFLTMWRSKNCENSRLTYFPSFYVTTKNYNPIHIHVLHLCIRNFHIITLQGYILPRLDLNSDFPNAFAVNIGRGAFSQFNVYVVRYDRDLDLTVGIIRTVNQVVTTTNQIYFIRVNSTVRCDPYLTCSTATCFSLHVT